VGSSGSYHNYSFVSAGSGHRGFLLSGFTKNFQPIMVTITKQCPDSAPDIQVKPIYPMLTILPEKPHGKVDSSGMTISGDGSDAQGGTSVTGSWSFSAEREP
jgi:hypothetical protein